MALWEYQICPELAHRVTSRPVPTASQCVKQQEVRSLEAETLVSGGDIDAFTSQGRSCFRGLSV